MFMRYEITHVDDLHNVHIVAQYSTISQTPLTVHGYRCLGIMLNKITQVETKIDLKILTWDDVINRVRAFICECPHGQKLTVTFEV